MRVLQVNKFFYVRGGSERYYFDLCDLLRERGHSVSQFSMKHGRNLPAPDQSYFVSEIDLNACATPAARARAAFRILYSWEAKAAIGRLMDSCRPDLVHCHNISRQLSPSILDAAHSRGIPIVETMHDLFLVCPAHSFFVNGAPCEACKSGAFWHATRLRCIDGSTASSVLGTAEAYLHAWARLYRKISLFIAPSLFLKSKVDSLGWTKDRTVHLPYFVPLGPDYSARNDGYALFAGRVSREKGVGVLLDAASMCRAVDFVIAGEGPELGDYRRAAARLGLANVRFVGYVKGEALEKLLAGARCVVVPSLSYENLPLSILEAFARGKPAVAADSGGIAELVKDDTTGYLFERGVSASLADAIERMASDDRRRERMGRNARQMIATDYSPAAHYQRLMGIYESVLK
ncbi:MAG: glycosyltransferase family 4 protein [bacterium]